MKTLTTKNVYLSLADFEKDLEICLEIILYPNQRNPYYVCEYYSASLEKSIVHIYITK